MPNRILNKSNAIVLLSAVIGATTASGWAASAAATKTTAADESSRLCKLDGKINSIGTVTKFDSQLYRCTSVLEERGTVSAAWVHVEMTTSIVVD